MFFPTGELLHPGGTDVRLGQFGSKKVPVHNRGKNGGFRENFVERRYDPLRAPHLIHMIMNNRYSHCFLGKIFYIISEKSIFEQTKTREMSRIALRREG